jgi:acetyl esterase/lipase
MNIKLWDNPPLYNEGYNNEHNCNCPSMDSYVLDDKNTHSCFIICPGGGYDHRSNHEGGNIAEELNKLGISAFVLNYRVAPYTHPTELADAKRAMRYVRFNADKFNIDPERIGIMGFSAGAHLACIEAEYYDRFELTEVDDIDKINARPNLLCLCYPVLTAGKSISHKGSIDNLLGDKTEYIEDMSCDENIREDMPPVFLWHTFADGSVDCRNSLVMAEKLKENNIPCELHLFPDGKHGTDLAKGIEGTEQWFGLFANWLKRNGFCI